MTQTTDEYWTLVANSEPLVTIHADKTMTFGENYTPDAAARLFWDAVLQAAPRGGQTMTPTREDLLSEREAATQERSEFVREADRLRARVAELEAENELLRQAIG